MRASAGLQAGRDKMPDELGGQVVPTCEVNPRFTSPSLFCKANTAANATSQTIYTTPADADFYLVACQLSMIKDAGATSTHSSLNLYVDGVAQNILSIPGITLTAQNQSISLSFPRPLKIDRNTIIAVQNGTNNANVLARASVTGFIVYNAQS